MPERTGKWLPGGQKPDSIQPPDWPSTPDVQLCISPEALNWPCRVIWRGEKLIGVAFE